MTNFILAISNIQCFIDILVKNLNFLNHAHVTVKVHESERERERKRERERERESPCKSPLFNGWHPYTCFITGLSYICMSPCLMGQNEENWLLQSLLFFLKWDKHVEWEGEKERERAHVTHHYSMVGSLTRLISRACHTFACHHV